MIERKTSSEIIKDEELSNEDNYVEYLSKEWVSIKSLMEHGIEIECQANGSNNPEDLEDGIFIPYRWFKKVEKNGSKNV